MGKESKKLAELVPEHKLRKHEDKPISKKCYDCATRWHKHCDYLITKVTNLEEEVKWLKELLKVKDERIEKLTEQRDGYIQEIEEFKWKEYHGKGK